MSRQLPDHRVELNEIQMERIIDIVKKYFRQLSILSGISTHHEMGTPFQFPEEFSRLNDLFLIIFQLRRIYFPERF